jgi:hypothetical protein
MLDFFNHFSQIYKLGCTKIIESHQIGVLKCLSKENNNQLWHKFDSKYKKPYSVLKIKMDFP